ncbi:hypothetical protein FSP39_005520 [Pinctada imbricata]|uniref:C2H2-type domain-containing protein n=1 Tax=Pinctada imbricata TaxID=66713 RepID=A0AA88Y7G8_PINIB|nr:hypothetical protein FSP39_005520 [Pinctada imbricata]
MAQNINAILQQAVLSLCKANYSDKIEIDAIICISSLKSSNHDVVKIHETVEAGKARPTNQNLIDSTLALSLGFNREQSPAVSNNISDVTRLNSDTPSTSIGNDMVGAAGSAKKTPKGRKRGRKAQNDDPDFCLSTAKGKEDGAEETAESESAKKLRRSTKRHRVSYADISPVDSEDSADLLDDANYEQATGNERYGLSDKPGPGGKNLSFGSASVLLKLLADPRAKKLGEQNKQAMLDSVMKGSGLLSGLRQEIPQSQISNMAFAEKDRNGKNSEENVEYDVVKAEPEWEGEYGGPGTSQSGGTREIAPDEDMENTNTAENPPEMSMDISSAADKTDDDQVLSVDVKDEPVWDENEYGTGKESESSKTGNQNKDANNTGSDKGDQSKNAGDNGKKSNDDGGKSILMNILKGPPLIDTTRAIQRPALSVESDSNALIKDKTLPPEQDNSLLYRLPYASFSELLFPHSTKNILLSSDGEKGERQLRTKDYLANLQQNQINHPTPQPGPSPSGRGRYKTRLKSGKNDPVRYKDLVGGNEYHGDEEVDEALRETGEDVYIPEVEPQDADSYVIKDDTNRRKRGGKLLGPKSAKARAARKAQQESDAASSFDFNTAFPLVNAASPQEREEEPPLSGPLAGTYFRCSICTRIFADKTARDEHEEEERMSLLIYQCPICDGFFGSEETKKKHMEDRHGIQTLSQEQRSQLVEKLVRKTPSSKKKRKPTTVKRKTKDYNYTITEDQEAIEDQSANEEDLGGFVEDPSFFEDQGANQSEEDQNAIDEEMNVENDEGSRSTDKNDESESEGVEINREIKTEKDLENNMNCFFCDMVFDSEDEKIDHLTSYHGVNKESIN